MAISSTEIQNLLSAQNGMFAASAQYSHQLSMQSPYQGAAPQAMDPRAQSAAQSAMMVSGGFNMMAGAGGAGMLAAGFGLAPRAFDPFTSAIHGAQQGMLMRGTMGGAVMGAGVGVGVGIALGSIFRWTADQVIAGAHQHAALQQQLSSMAPQFSGQGLSQMATTTQGMARQYGSSLNEMTQLIQQGGADGSLNMQSVGTFQQSFRQLVQNVSQTAAALKSSLSEAQQAMVQLKSIGIDHSQAGSFAYTMRSIGAGSGASPQEVMGWAAQGSEFGRATGIGRTHGALGSMMNRGVTAMVHRHGLIAGMDGSSFDRMTNASARFLGSGWGRPVLAAMMGEDGELDETVAQGMASGAYSRDQIRRMSRQRLSTASGRDRFQARQSELMGEFMTQFGPAAIQPALQEMTRHSNQGESLRAGLTGLTRDDLHQMQQLNQAMPNMRARLAQAGQDALQQQPMSLTESLTQSLDRIVRPFKTRLQDYGAELSRSMQHTIERFTEDLVGRPPERSDPSAYQRYVGAVINGGGSNNQVSASLRRGMGGGGSSFFQPSFRDPQMSFAGMNVGMLPSGLRIDGAGPGVSMSDLPGYGLFPDQHTMAGAALIGASVPTIGGANAIQWAGRGLGSLGADLMAAPGTSIAAGGVGFASGAMRGAGGLARLGGWGLQGLGFAARALGPAMIAADLAFNEGPALQRAMGWRGVTRGAVLGDAANVLRYGSDEGLFTDGSDVQRMQLMDMGLFGGMGGNTPVGGIVGEGGGEGTGYQYGANKRFLGAADRFMRGAPALLGGMEQKYGDRGRRLLQRAMRADDSMQGQAAELAVSLGIDETEAKRYIAAANGSRLQERALRSYDAEGARRAFLDGSSDPASVGSAAYRQYNDRPELRAAHAAMLAGMDPQKAANAGVSTVDELFGDLERSNIAWGSERWTDRVTDHLSRITPSGGGALTAAEELARGDRSELRPEGLSRWTEIQDKLSAQRFLKYTSDRHAVVGGQADSAMASARLAGMAGGMDGLVDSARAYSNAFSPSVASSGMTGQAEALRGLGGRLMRRGGRSSSIMAAAGVFGRGDTEFDRAGMSMALQLAPIRGATERKRGVRDVLGTMGVDLSNVSASRLRDNLARERSLDIDSDIAAPITAAYREAMQQTGQPLNEDSVQAGGNRIIQAMREYRTNPNAFDGVAVEIATMRTMSTAGGTPKAGDVTKQMAEVMLNLKQFGEILGGINTTLKKIGLGGD